MMNKILLLLFIFLQMLVISCDTKLVTTEDEEIANELKSIENPTSDIELIENTGFKSEVSCNPKNSVKLIATQNQNDIILCKETGQLETSLKVGPVCPGGVVLKAISSSTDWVKCEDITLCGIKPTSVVELKSTSTSQLRQLQFTGLPWGCQSKVEVKKSSASEVLKEFSVKIEAPRCPLCSISKIETCEACGIDNKAPTITDVFTESFQCNQIRVLVFAQDDNAGLHENAYSFDNGLTWQAESFKDFVGLERVFALNSVWVKDRSGNIAKHPKGFTATASPCPCDTPWGEKLAHGQKRKAFKTSTVACTTTCDANSLERTCNNGLLSGTNDYSSANCTVVGCPKCRLPWGEDIENGVSVDAYIKASAPCAGECLKKSLSCDRGTLVGDFVNYRSKSCSFTKPSCDCQHAGIVIKNGEKKSVFASTEVACGSTCSAGEVSCSSGTLSGQTSLQNLSCSPKICKCTTPWGENIDLNQTVPAYKKDVMACDENMACNHASNLIKIKCVNVVTNKFDVVEGTGAMSEFTKPNCSASVCGCSHLGLIFRPIDPPVKVYKIEEAMAPAKCDLAGNSGTVSCTGTSPNFNITGDKNTAIFKFLKCKDISVPGTGTGTGTSPVSIGPGTGGGAGGGIGNDEGEGEGFRRRMKGGSGFGSGCDVNKPPYICMDLGAGVFSQQSFCLLPETEGYDLLQTNSDNYKQRISPGGAVAAFSKKTVACGDSCSKYMGVVSCDNGVMSNKSKYNFLDCRELCP